MLFISICVRVTQREDSLRRYPRLLRILVRGAMDRFIARILRPLSRHFRPLRIIYLQWILPDHIDERMTPDFEIPVSQVQRMGKFTKFENLCEPALSLIYCGRLLFDEVLGRHYSFS